MHYVALSIFLSAYAIILRFGSEFVWIHLISFNENEMDVMAHSVHRVQFIRSKPVNDNQFFFRVIIMALYTWYQVVTHYCLVNSSVYGFFYASIEIWDENEQIRLFRLFLNRKLEKVGKNDQNSNSQIKKILSICSNKTSLDISQRAHWNSTKSCNM